MRLGFVGAGRMGLPMVRRLVAAGHEVRVVGRSEQARESLAGEGVEAVTSLGAAAEGAEAVIVCVFTDEQVEEVCFGGDLIGALPGGATLVVHTTGSPGTVEKIAARGVAVVDAPVSGGPQDIAAGEVTLFVGGADQDVAGVRPVLAAYGDPVLHVGPLGAGQRVKLVNNALFAAHLGLLADAVRLGGQLGVGESTLLAALPHGSAASRALAGVARRGSVAAFAGVAGLFVGKDVTIARQVTGEFESDLGSLDGALRALDRVLEYARDQLTPPR